MLLCPIILFLSHSHSHSNWSLFMIHQFTPINHTYRQLLLVENHSNFLYLWIHCMTLCLTYSCLFSQWTSISTTTWNRTINQYKTIIQCMYSCSMQPWISKLCCSDSWWSVWLALSAVYNYHYFILVYIIIILYLLGVLQLSLDQLHSAVL